MLEVSTSQNRRFTESSEMMIFLSEMVKVFHPTSEERGYQDKKAQDIKLRMDNY